MVLLSGVQLVMAEMNLLKSSISGSMGNITGSVYKGTPVVRSRIEGKAPPTPLQTHNVRAFERLNRLAVQLSMSFWQYMGLSDRDMHRHNAVARWAKVLIANHDFDLDQWDLLLPHYLPVTMGVPSQDVVYGDITVHFACTDWSSLPPGTLIHLVACDPYGYTGQPQTVPAGPGPFVLSAPQADSPVYQVISFLSFPGFRGRKLVNSTTTGAYVINYSLVEQNTGVTWIDGRPIFQRTLVGPGSIPITAAGSLAVGQFASPLILENLVSVELHFNEFMGEQGVLSSSSGGVYWNNQPDFALQVFWRLSYDAASNLFSMELRRSAAPPYTLYFECDYGTFWYTKPLSSGTAPADPALVQAKVKKGEGKKPKK